MPRLLIIAHHNQAFEELCTHLTRNGLACSIASYDEAVEIAARQPPELLLVEMDGKASDSEKWELIQRLKHEKNVPTIALVPRETLDSINGHLDADDFLTSPYDAGELALRVKRLLYKNGRDQSHELIKCDGLMIDLATCEVMVDGRKVELTFKEYELLKLLASNKGRVYTREALLNRIWGYDYYGGDRTVDVHVRRLRSKIEDANHTFIETVRNIGYRFRKDTNLPRL